MHLSRATKKPRGKADLSCGVSKTMLQLGVAIQGTQREARRVKFVEPFRKELVYSVWSYTRDYGVLETRGWEKNHMRNDAHPGTNRVSIISNAIPEDPGLTRTSFPTLRSARDTLEGRQKASVRPTPGVAVSLDSSISSVESCG